MWVFGYGSLMWDGWEGDYGCSERSVATVQGYRRVLNKASVVNWGSASSPGPTLNLVPDAAAICSGMAFLIPDSETARTIAYLERREGRDFLFKDVDATLADGRKISAQVAIYSGRNLIDATSDDELVAKIMAAKGRDGTAADYVRNVAAKLSSIGVSDSYLTSIVEKLSAG
jgi:cation transport protein ChaC